MNNIEKELKEFEEQSRKNQKYREERISLITNIAKTLKKSIIFIIFGLLIVFLFMNKEENNYMQLTYFIQAFKLSIFGIVIGFIFSILKNISKKSQGIYIYNLKLRKISIRIVIDLILIIVLCVIYYILG